MADRYGRPTVREQRSGALYRLSVVADPRLSPQAKLTGIAMSVRVCRAAGCDRAEMSRVSGLTIQRLEELEEM